MDQSLGSLQAPTDIRLSKRDRSRAWWSDGGRTGSWHPYYIPVAYSDFIFAAIGEELGLLGTTAVVVGFLLVVGAGIRAAMRARSEFSQLAAVGFTAILGSSRSSSWPGWFVCSAHRVSLPFIGYGGSSLVANYVLVALLMRISDEGATPPGVAIGLRHPVTRMRRRALVAARAAPAPCSAGGVSTVAGGASTTHGLARQTRAQTELRPTPACQRQTKVGPSAGGMLS